MFKRLLGRYAKKTERESAVAPPARGDSSPAGVPGREERLLLALCEASRVVQQVREPSKVLQRVCDEIAGLGYNAVLFVLDDEHRWLTVEYLTYDSNVLRAVEKLAGVSTVGFRFELLSGAFYERLLREGEARFVEAGAEPFAEVLPAVARPVAKQLASLLGVDRAIYVPLTVDGERYGLLAVLGESLASDNISAMAAFGGQIATAIENAHAIDRLQQERDRAQSYLDIAGAMLVAVDREGRITLINKRGCDVLARSEDELLGRDWFDTCLPERIRENVRRGFVALIEGGGQLSEEAEAAVTRADDEERMIRWHNTKLVDGEGRITGLLSSGEDITERHLMMEALRESKELAERMIDTANAVIVEFDPDGRIARFNDYAERLTGFTRSEVLGRDWFTTFIPPRDRSSLPNVFSGVLDRREDAFSHVNAILCRSGEERIVEWRNTTITEADGTVRGVLSVGVDITERERALEDLKESEQWLFDVLEGTIAAFARTVEARDPYTAGHQEHVARLGAAVARKLGLPNETVDSVRVAGLLHDIGKISVPAEILAKPTRLNDVEWSLMQQHPEDGYRILEGIHFPWPVAKIIRQHHERMDGTGYPNGLTGEEILLEARILAVSDTVEAMAAHRPYRPAVGLEAALDEIRDGRGTAYDATVVDACIELFNQDGFSFEVEDTA